MENKAERNLRGTWTIQTRYESNGTSTGLQSVSKGEIWRLLNEETHGFIRSLVDKGISIKAVEKGGKLWQK